MSKINLPGMPAYYDDFKIVEYAPGGIYLSDHPNHLILVDTGDVLYGFISHNGQIEGKATRNDGRVPLVIGEHTTDIHIHGSVQSGVGTLPGYIATGMQLEFSFGPVRVTTGKITCIRVAPLVEAPA